MEYIENDRLKIAVSSHGAELSSIYDKTNDREMLWQADPNYWDRHAPVLFPFVGNCNRGVYRYKGKEYSMTPHGFARDKEFELLEKTKTSVSFVLRDDDDTKKIYPFDFELVITHVLTDNKISVIWDIKNPSRSEDLYYSIGGHPAFSCPLGDNESRNDYKVKFEKNDLEYVLILQETREVDYQNPNKLSLTDGYLQITDDLFQKDALIFDNSQVKEISLCTPDGKEYVTMHCEGFPSFGLWSKPSKDARYVCLEPWIGRCDNKGFEGELPEKYCVQHLAPNEVKREQYEIVIH
ncbi:MAG: aldose 1-epimerase family protein [Butyrivibrio sp.]|nr:aldose 1-epimerase family protein [Butyrivibrio sp.]